MFVDNFWKIIFIALIGVGCWFWWGAASAKKLHRVQIAALAELIDISGAYAPKSDKEAAERIFQAVAQLETIALRQKDKFNVSISVREAIALTEMDQNVADLLSTVIEQNYDAARDLDLLNDDALFQMEAGSRPKIEKGPWKGQRADVGYWIPPSVNESVAAHLCNRLIMPEGVKGTMAAGVVTREVESRAKRLKGINALDLAATERIQKEYNALRRAR
jgi:hypothetical protein